MDAKLDSLIAKIKKDGVEVAQKAAQDIISQAKNQAQGIIAEAENKAKNIEEQSKIQAQKLQTNTEKALNQAARDLVLLLKEKITELFDQALKNKVSQELDPDFLKDLILKIVDKWLEAKDQSLEIVVNPKDKKKLEALLVDELGKKAQDKIEIGLNKAIDNGFRIGVKGKDLYYDFTDQTILESLKEFLNPAISKIVDTK
jgi:V/A-type H+-transporting ATPase subunit E